MYEIEELVKKLRELDRVCTADRNILQESFIMVDIERRVTYEADDEYIARTFDEAYKELFKVRAGLSCGSFCSGKHCPDCKFYAAENVEYMASKNMSGEKCLITLAMNYVSSVAEAARNGEPIKSKFNPIQTAS